MSRHTASARPDPAVVERAVVLRRTGLNAVSLFLAYLLPRLLTFGAAVVAARVLGASTFGSYGTAAALAVMLSVAATLGMMPLLIRDIARSPERAPALIGAAHVVKTVANVVMLGTLFVLARWVLHYPPEVVTAAMLLGTAYAVGAYGESFGAYFQGIERMQVWMQASSLFGLVSGSLGVVLVASTASVTAFCVAPVVGQIVAVTWLVLRAPPAVRLGIPKRVDISALLVSLVPFAVGFMVLTLYYKVDVLLLTHWRPSRDVGIYIAAYRFIDVAQALSVVAVSALYPRLSRVHSRVGDSSRMTSRRLTELVLLGSVPAAGALWLFRAPLIQLLFDTPYIEAVGVLALLALVIPALALNILMSFNLAAAERMGAVAAVYAGGLAINVALNVVFIPRLGAEGAALAMLVSELSVAVGFLVTTVRAVGAYPRWRPVLTAAAAALACVMVRPMTEPLGVAGTLVAYVLVTAAIYRAGAVLHASEWEALRAVFPVSRRAST